MKRNRMSAREDILHLINRYTFTIDTGDLEGFASLFEYGEWIMKDAEPIVGRQQVRDAISRIRIYEDGTPRTKHITSNIDITPVLGWIRQRALQHDASCSTTL